MELIETTRQALRLLFAGDAELWRIVWVSLKISVGALLLMSPVAIAVGYLLATQRFPGRRIIVVVTQALFAFPTVVVGLLLYMLLSRQGPLGSLHLLFTQTAMMIGQMLIAAPILVAFTLSAVQGADARVRETAIVLGAGRWRTALTVLTEVRFGVMAALFNGFGRVISEVGCALMVGGNIAGMTRNMPTAIALETTKGEFAQGVALGIVLMVLALGVNFAMSWAQGAGAQPQ
ncbi:MAG: ABC transporter permease [Betaproteobacteria bacterium SG8_40]|nr:MAG: ABC transporter permease [Betaproteobacteria bacterium SG8_40]